MIRKSELKTSSEKPILIPLDFETAISALLKVKPEKPKRGKKANT